MRSAIKLWFPVTTGLVKLVLEGSGWLAWRLRIHTAPCLLPAVLSRTCQFLKWAEDQYITCYISLSSLRQTACLRGKEITSVPAHRILASYHLRVSARSRKKERKTRAKEEKSTTSRSAWLVSSENVMPCVNLKLWKSYPFSTLPRSRGEVGTY